MIPNINLRLRLPRNFSCRFVCLLNTTRGQSHLSLNSFLSFFTTAWIGLLRPRLAYFTMKRESYLSIDHDFLRAPERPEVSSSSRIACSLQCLHFLQRLELPSDSEGGVLIRINFRHAQIGIFKCHRCQECESKLDPLEDSSLVMPMMMAIVVKILYQFS
jgi:hypothetical protein